MVAAIWISARRLRRFDLSSSQHGSLSDTLGREMIQDFERFQNELDALRKLFGPSKRLDVVLPRLREIYEYTERKWCAYAGQIPQGIVQYVLIAEAPPWS